MIANFPGLSSWIGRGFWAITDYGLFASSNFVLNLLLVRWLAPSEYGAFTIGFTIFLFLTTFQTGLFIAPMQVFGVDKSSLSQSDYLGTVLACHLGFTILAGIVCLMGGLGFWLKDLGMLYPTLFSLAFAAPSILWLWLMRNACAVYLASRIAAAAGLLYLLLMVAGAYALHLRNWLSPASAMAVMGLSSLAAALWLAVRLKHILPRPHLRKGNVVRETMSSHWRFGRWMIGVTVLAWFIMSIWNIVLPAWGGLAASGTFRALLILILPPVFALYGASRILIGSLVRARGDGSSENFVRAALLLFVFGSTFYWIFLGVFGRFLLTWLYGQYGEYTYFLWILGSALPFEGASAVLRSVLLAQERPDLVFWAYLFSSVVALAAGVPLALKFGIWGAGIGFVLAHLVSTGSMWTLVGRAGRGSESHPAGAEVLMQPANSQLA